MTDTTFNAMGCEIRLIAPAAAIQDAQRWLQDFDARLSRFRDNSELCALNADPRALVPASPLLRATVAAGLWAARRSGGLVDPTLLPELERAGYAQSRTGSEPIALADALRTAPARRPARPATYGRWRDIEVSNVIERPPGVRIDSGGIGKGLAADALAHRMRAHANITIDCAGDVRIVNADAPVAISIEHPLTAEVAHSFAIGDGAVATSGIGRRVWRNPDGACAHHLIDPSTGEPAWTGLVQTTAIAPTALEAETLAKTALLAGPEHGPAVLEQFGGALIHDDGDVELVGALRLMEVAA
ncbi:MAG: FAD:protein transferase [Thermoleophilaceae bacterium]|nr:FAD:protein transferase [Thermoleophilaceae bacterium]